MPTDISLKTISVARVDARTARVNITDSRSAGLVLRGGPAGLTWQHRVQLAGKPCRLVLGTVDRWSIAEARAIANAATDYAKSHKRAPDDAWLQAHLVETGKIEAPAAGEIGGEFPTFAQGREEYLAAAKHWLSESTHGGYRLSLSRSEMKVLDDKRLPTINRDDIMEIVHLVHGDHERAAEQIISAIRPMWNFLGEDGRRRRYGVEPGIMGPLQFPKRKIVEAAEDENDDDDPWSVEHYVPSIDELGRIIATARCGVMSPIVGLAVELTCWTVQRRRTIVSARLQDFFDLGDGTGLWRIPAVYRKGGRRNKRPHTIPLPAPAWACVMRASKEARERDPETRWLFPAARPRRIGDIVANTNVSTLGHAFGDIPDCGATTHAVRRTMGTHGEALLGFARIDSGTIMDHAESVKASDRLMSRTAGTGTHDVTGIHYSLHDGSHHTWPVMRAWCDALQRSIDSETPALDLKRVAKGFGDPGYRLGKKPAQMLVPLGPLQGDELEEWQARQRIVQSRVVALGVADDDV